MSDKQPSVTNVEPAAVPYGGSFTPSNTEKAAYTAHVREITEQYQDQGEAAKLAELGYQQEVKRNMTMIGVLGLSFAIMAVPLGVSLMLGTFLTCGGPVTMVYGWTFVSGVSMCMASSLAEICSVYPTSGGVYYWSAMLSPPKFSRFASYLTGWFAVVSNWTLAGSIAFGGSQLVLAAVTLFHEDYVPTAWQTLLVYWAALAVEFVINLYGNDYIDRLNTFVLYWTGTSTIIIIVTLLAKSDHYHSGKFVFSEFANNSGWPDGWSFFVGLLSAAYVLTGYGTVSALCEEVHNPEREVPRAMVLSVAAAFVTGIVLLIPIAVVLPLDIEALLAVPSGQPMPLLFKMVTHSAPAAMGLLSLVLGIWAFASVGSLTTASRATWAFSRDGGIPGSQWWKRVNTRRGVPVWSLALSTVVCGLLGLLYLGSSAAFNAFTGVATICLGCSYAFPILCSLLTRREHMKRAAYPLGNTLGYTVNIIAVVWITFSIVLFSMPTAIPVTAETTNYASVVFVAFAVIAAGWYFANARKHYAGPLVSIVRREEDAESRRASAAPSRVASRVERDAA
ncbi:hypothetical protein Q8F55_002969 [Vanrija albida]|uniref:Amino acid permease/ SLC12A domain-containing protein n=1 Tax=Vanrija albida TaxID=181172 RepID=A0ABR3QB85_9TREE